MSIQYAASIGVDLDARVSSCGRLAELPPPPLTETVLSIQFATLVAFRTVHAGLFWHEMRETYPQASEKPPLAPAFETFGGPAALLALNVPQIQAFLTPPMPRFWFEAEDGEHLFQLQQDRVLHNWRKRDESQEYPRYSEIRRRLGADVAQLESFLRHENLDSLRPNQCEVTYINTIQLADSCDPHQQLEAVTPLWSAWTPGPSLGQLEGAELRMRFILQGKGGPVGRVYVNFTPGYLQVDHRPVLQLEVTARGRPDAETVPAAFAFLDTAHEAVVRTFAMVTTSKMHVMWERTDG